MKRCLRWTSECASDVRGGRLPPFVAFGFCTFADFGDLEGPAVVVFGEAFKGPAAAVGFRPLGGMVVELCIRGYEYEGRQERTE